MKLIQRYVISEFIGPLILSLLIFTFVLLTRRIDDLIMYFSVHGVGAKLVFTLLGLLLPSLITLTLPMGLLIACLTVFGRWNSDREMLALRSGGVNPWTVMLPLIIISFIASFFLLYFTTSVVPWTYSAILKTKYQIASSLAENLSLQSFNKFGSGLVVYVQDHGDKPGKYKGLTLFYSKSGKVNQILTAQEGSIGVDLEKGKTTLQLNKGSIQKFDNKDPEHYYIGTFDQWVSITELDRFLRPDQGDKKPGEFSMTDLRQKIKEILATGKSAAEYQLEIGRRYAMPFACVVFILIGAPLGNSFQVKNKTLSFFFGVLLIGVYWILLTFSESMGMKGKLPAQYAPWLPNMILGSLGIYLTWRTCRQ